MNRSDLFDTKEFGKLEIDKILLESYYPILFTCKNQSGDVFICVCSQNNADYIVWLVGKTNPIYMLKFLKDEITLRQLFQNFCDDKIIIKKTSADDIVDYKDDGVWRDDSKYLPQENSFLYSDPGEFDDEIEYYQNMITVDCNATYNDSVRYNYNNISENRMELFPTVFIPSCIENAQFESSIIESLSEVSGSFDSYTDIDIDELTEKTKKIVLTKQLSVANSKTYIREVVFSGLTDAA